MILVSAHPHACFIMTAGAFTPLGILAVGDFDLMAELFSRIQARMDSDVRMAQKYVELASVQALFRYACVQWIGVTAALNGRGNRWVLEPR